MYQRMNDSGSKIGFLLVVPDGLPRGLIPYTNQTARLVARLMWEEDEEEKMLNTPIINHTD